VSKKVYLYGRKNLSHTAGKFFSFGIKSFEECRPKVTEIVFNRLEAFEMIKSLIEARTGPW
jgi:hypothetical protein